MAATPEGRIDVGEFVGDFGTMTRFSARHPDFSPRSAAASAGETPM